VKIPALSFLGKGANYRIEGRMKGLCGLMLVTAGVVLSTFHHVLAQGGPVVEWDLKSEESRAAVVTQLRNEAVAARDLAWQSAADEVWSSKGGGPGFQYELQAIRGDRPYVYRTMNVNAAISTAASLIRNTAPYNVNGAGETVGIWDGGAVRSTHQELTGRVTVMDGAAIIDHSTHVGGTIGASGVVAGALGMAPSVLIASYDWNSDLSEMTSRGMAVNNESGKIQLSNHSYGTLAGWDTSDGTYKWYGAALTDREDASFGQYYSTARDWDTLCYSAPYYLPCKAAGNDRSDLAPPAGTTFSYYSRRKWVTKTYDPATDPYNDGYNNGGFDTLEPTGTAKNILTVGAVYDAVSGGSRSLAAAAMIAFSGWGPTDDGRVKPDVVGNGYSLYSSIGSGDASYGYYSGTSMATPNVCGSVTLLTDYYGQLFPGQCMLASTLKGLIIHTADDLGTAGPDYKFGWGLVNVKAAADVIKLHYDEPSAQHLVEQLLDAATTSRTNSFTWTGTNAIRVTLCWTDPSGAAQTGLDVTTKNLVNDLDLRVIGPQGQVYLPYVLAPATPDVAATTGDNSIDNVEQVYIATPGTSGVCRITVSLHGGLSGSSQRYSVIFSVLGSLVSSYTVTFDGQGGTTPVPASKSVTYGSAYGTLATTSRGGYTFGGWWTGEGGTGAEVTAATTVTVTAAQTLYAKWTAESYTVAFDGQGGTTPVPTSKSVTYGGTYGTLATTSRTGYTFGGWWTGAGGTGTEVTAATTVTVTSAQTLYAKWTANSYTVTFDEQGGSTPVPTSKSVTYGGTYGTLATTSRTGYTFGGWWTGAGGTGAEVTAATTVTVTAAQTLYAKWIPTMTSTTPVPVPYAWLDQYPILLGLAGGDYETAALADVDGDGHLAWQEYVAGSVPTNRESVFMSLISVSNGVAWVTWTPDLGTARVYTVYGRTNLTEGAWGSTNVDNRFFRVNVWMH
jgi:uncharacterized repeat protein (TIGR02543 family)